MVALVTCRRVVTILAAVLAAAGAVALPDPEPAQAASAADFQWLSRRGVAGWPQRNDWNYARTTTFQSTSTDGRWTLMSAGSQSGGNGGDWSAIFLKDTVTGDTTLVTTDESGQPFPGSTGNANGLLSPAGRWMVWDHVDGVGQPSFAYARNIATGQVYRMPGDRTSGPRTVTDNGIVYLSYDTTALPGGSPFIRLARWDVAAGTVVPVDDPTRPTNTFIDMENISGDGRYLFVQTAGKHHVLDVDTGSVSILPYTPRPGTHVGVLSVNRSGRYVLLTADDPTLNPAGVGPGQVYLLDRETGAVDWISAPSPGGQVEPTYGYSATWRAVSDDGRYVMFGGDIGRLDIPPLDPAHVGERSNYFAGAVFLRDRVQSTTTLVLPTYSYGIAIDARAAVFDTPNSIDPSDPGSVDVYLYRPSDTQPPTVTATPDRAANSNGWYNAPVTIAWSSVDPPPSSGSPSTPAPTTVTTEGANQTVTSTASCDLAGNCAVGHHVVSIDTGAPSITASVAPAANSNGWANGTVTVTFACTDAVSGVDSCTPPVTISEQVTGQVVTGTAVDRAGNTATAEAVISIDSTGPVIAAVSNGPGDGGWSNAPVTITFTCADTDSGIDACPDAVELIAEGAGQTASGTATDRAGNSATATIANINIDRTPPVVTVAGPQSGHTYLAGHVPPVTCATTDALSGVAMEATPLTIGGDEGTVTVRCLGGADQAGNTADASITYMIVTAVRPVATNTRQSVGNNSLSVTVPPSGVAVDDTLIVSVATGTFNGPAACTDTNGNIYTVLADRNTGNGRLFICAAHLTQPLDAGDTITATYPGFSGLSLISANAIAAAATSSSVAAASTANGNNANPNSGLVSVTMPNTLLFGAISHNSTPTFATGSDYTLVGQVVGGTGSGRRTLSPEYRLTSTAGGYAATGTLTGGQFWQAAIVAFQPA